MQTMQLFYPEGWGEDRAEATDCEVKVASDSDILLLQRGFELYCLCALQWWCGEEAGVLLQGGFKLCSYFAFIVFRVGGDGEEHCVRSDSGVGRCQALGRCYLRPSPWWSLWIVNSEIKRDGEEDSVIAGPRSFLGTLSWFRFLSVCNNWILNLD